MITNNRDLAKAWDWLHFYTTTEGLPSSPSIKARVLDLKHDIRRFNRAIARQRVIAWEDDYGYVEKVEAPKECIDLEDVEDWFERYERIEYIDRGYDCTGQMFTSWYKVVKLHGEWWVYHRISCDC